MPSTPPATTTLRAVSAPRFDENPVGRAAPPDAVAAAGERLDDLDLGLRDDPCAALLGEVEVVLVERVLRAGTAADHAPAAERAPLAPRPVAAEVRVVDLHVRLAEEHADVGRMEGVAEARVVPRRGAAPRRPRPSAAWSPSRAFAAPSRSAAASPAATPRGASTAGRPTRSRWARAGCWRRAGCRRRRRCRAGSGSRGTGACPRCRSSRPRAARTSAGRSSWSSGNPRTPALALLEHEDPVALLGEAQRRD